MNPPYRYPSALVTLSVLPLAAIALTMIGALVVVAVIGYFIICQFNTLTETVSC